jgi:hypothetical protein
MAIQFEGINELAAERAARIVPEQDAEVVANGARITSEVILRTLGKLGVRLPHDFPTALTAEFDLAERQESAARDLHLDNVRRFEASA